jgi:hypothetical protein
MWSDRHIHKLPAHGIDEVLGIPLFPRGPVLGPFPHDEGPVSSYIAHEL